MYDIENMDLRYRIFATTFLMANRLQMLMDQQIQDITCKQWFVLTMLDTFEQAPTLKDLSRACDSSHQNTKQIVAKLEAKGYVRIERDQADGRALRLHKTEKSSKWRMDNKDKAAAFVDAMFSKLSDQEIKMMFKAQQCLYQTLGEMEV